MVKERRYLTRKVNYKDYVYLFFFFGGGGECQITVGVAPQCFPN